jgi:hypothetical protein
MRTSFVSHGFRRAALAVFPVFFLAASGLPACGDPPVVAPASQIDLDAEPMSLLPSAAIVYARLDARAFFASQSFGPDLAKAAEKGSPLGAEAGFLPSRDLDVVHVGVYSTQGADVAAVLTGRFDLEKIKNLAVTHAPTHGGSAIVTSQYAGRDIYTINNFGFTVLTAKTAIAGTETGIRRVLDRIHDRRVKRDAPPWVETTLTTAGAVLAIAGDTQAQPGAAESLRQLPVPWMAGAQKARVLMDFNAPGSNVGATLTYAEEAQATTAGQALNNTATSARLLAFIGLQFREFKVNAEKTDVQVKISVHDQSLRTLAQSLPQWLGQ